MLKNNHGFGPTSEWKHTLLIRLWISDFFAVGIALLVGLIVRYQNFWADGINDFEIQVLVQAIIIYFVWLFSLQFLGSREINILGFGADEYRRVLSASFSVFAILAIVSYVFKLEISRGFVAITLVMGVLFLFITRRTLRKILSRAREQGRYLFKSVVDPR